MDKVARTFGLVASGATLVASHVLSYQGNPHEAIRVVDLLHFSFPLVVYVFAHCLIDEGRARERAEQERRERAGQ